MHYKKLAEVEKALAKRLDASKTEKGYEGYTNVPWHVAVRELNEVFGVFGWDEHITHQQFDAKAGIYTVTRELTVHVQDEEGHVVSKTVVGVGASSVLGESAKAQKTAAMGADSLSLAKATKHLGDAFGLYLYSDDDEAEKPAQRSGGYTSSKSSSGPRKGPSDKQLAIMLKNGYTEDEVEEMDFKTWKGILDAIFDALKAGEKYKRPGAKRAAPAKKPAARESFFDEDDDDEESA